MENLDTSLPIEVIESKIYLIRGKKVMLDRDLARLYGVKTQALNQAVRRNLSRFPEDFMFQMSSDEIKDWISQFVISNPVKMGLRKPPLAFTEQGVAMLSSVLRSDRAIQVNIQIVRTFTQLREMLATNKDLREKIEKLETKYDQNFKLVFDAIKRLITPEEKPKNEIGFR